MAMAMRSLWCARAKMATLVWVLLLLFGAGLVDAQSGVNCGNNSVEFFVPRGEGVHDSVRVTYSNGVGDEGSETGAPFLQCCGWAMSLDSTQSSTRSLNCSILADDCSHLHSNASPSPDFCLRVNSSLNSYIAGGRASHGRCALRADAAVSLSVYLKWLSSSESSFLASVQTRAECSNDNLPCTLTVGTSSSEALGAVEWNGNLSREQRVLLSQEYLASLTSRRKNHSEGEAQIFDFSVSSVRPMLRISKHVEAANAFHLGRRSLLASTSPLNSHQAVDSLAVNVWHFPSSKFSLCSFG